MKVLETSKGQGVFLIHDYKSVFDAVKWFTDQLGTEDLDDSILEKPLSKIAIETGVSLFPCFLEIKEELGKMTYKVTNLDKLKFS